MFLYARYDLFVVSNKKAMGKNKKIKLSLPQNLSIRTKNYMREVVEELEANDAFKATDQAMLVALALSYEVMLKSGKVLVEEGVLKTNIKGEEVSSSAQVTFFKGISSVASIAAEYGLTPKSRGNIKAMQETKEDESPLDKLIKDGVVAQMRIAK